MERFTIEWFDRQIEQERAAMLVKFESERQAEIAWRDADQRQFDAAQAEFERLIQCRPAFR